MDRFANPVWNALQTRHRAFAVMNGSACRYPADMAPFAAVAEPDEKAMCDLYDLLVPGEAVWVAGEDLRVVKVLETIECLQMLLSPDAAPAGPPHETVVLNCRNETEMIALTEIAFPGFFRPRTCEMGRYLGIRVDNQLVAMGGERLALEGYTEISGICTHPDHRSRGYAAAIVRQLAAMHRANGIASWLHVTSTNLNAIRLYRGLGFETVSRVMMNRVRAD